MSGNPLLRGASALLLLGCVSLLSSCSSDTSQEDTSAKGHLGRESTSSARNVLPSKGYLGRDSSSSARNVLASLDRVFTAQTTNDLVTRTELSQLLENKTVLLDSLIVNQVDWNTAEEGWVIHSDRRPPRGFAYSIRILCPKPSPDDLKWLASLQRGAPVFVECTLLGVYAPYGTVGGVDFVLQRRYPSAR